MPQSDSFNYRSRIKHGVDVATSYSQRKQKKHNAEMEVIRKALSQLGNTKTILDIPCGVGRAAILLAKQGYQVTAADLGAGAVQLAREQIAAAGVQAEVESQDIEEMSYGDRQFDGILCFRLYHHFPNHDVRERVVRELCRVADKYVLISYFNAYSWTSIKRKLRRRMTGRISVQHATRLADLTEYFEANGFQLIADIPRTRFVHTLHLGVYERKSGI